MIRFHHSSPGILSDQEPFLKYPYFKKSPDNPGFIATRIIPVSFSAVLIFANLKNQKNGVDTSLDLVVRQLV
jgi:hypothetical protein